MNLFQINSPDQRASLEARDKPYFSRVTNDLHIGYKKGKSVRRWVVRRRERRRYCTRTLLEAIPDDELPANGDTVLSFDQALLKVMNMTIDASNKHYIRHCSFCLLPQQEVDTLIAGPSSYICGECVATCNHIIEHRIELNSGEHKNVGR